ncbi:complement component C1q receptor-like [Syngnathus typhle]|uniref:complement component C1q receptor-like n=1 Tax=Syngnathus typhle TaxID=161592 RepID=UPI002A69A504|nr:complement component C1q receptor-like [Syngnathus typhle]
MARLNLQVLVTLSLLCWSSIFGTRRAATCRPLCVGSECLLIHRDQVDFTTAQERCQANKGVLMTLQSAEEKQLLDMAAQELAGNFWLGLHLPGDACSNLSHRMRGYEWTSGKGHSERRVLSSIAWKDSVRVCSPSCVSLSRERKLREWPCSHRMDGFLCRTSHQDACPAQELSDGTFFPSSKGCSGAPCEHVCTPVKDGFKCSCFGGYAADRTDGRRCRVHCAEETCPAVCEKNSGGVCFCPDGFVLSDQLCEDIDECSMNECEHECQNTFGSFVCACKEGYVLRHQVKCVKAVHEPVLITTPSVRGYVKPDNDTTKASTLSAATFTWLWIFAALAVVAFICVGRFYVMKRLKHRERQNLNPSGP